MAVSIAQLADALRVENPEDEAVLDNLTHWLVAARELVNSRAPDAPVAVKDGGIIKLAGYLFDQPTTSRGSGFANALTNSGALALLGPWVVRRVAGAAAEANAAALDPADTTPAPAVLYGIAVAWIEQLAAPPVNPLNSAFVNQAFGLSVPFPDQAANQGYVNLWLEDRTPGNPAPVQSIGITHTSGLVPFSSYATSPYPYSLDGKHGHLWQSSQLLGPLGGLFDGQTVEVILREN